MKSQSGSSGKGTNSSRQKANQIKSAVSRQQKSYNNMSRINNSVNAASKRASRVGR